MDFIADFLMNKYILKPAASSYFTHFTNVHLLIYKEWKTSIENYHIFN